MRTRDQPQRRKHKWANWHFMSDIDENLSCPSCGAEPSRRRLSIERSKRLAPAAEQETRPSSRAKVLTRRQRWSHWDPSCPARGRRLRCKWKKIRHGHWLRKKTRNEECGWVQREANGVLLACSELQERARNHLMLAPRQKATENRWWNGISEVVQLRWTSTVGPMPPAVRDSTTTRQHNNFI
jgi:rubredoxin